MYQNPEVMAIQQAYDVMSLLLPKNKMTSVSELASNTWRFL
jgi:hypothetical protein